MSLEEQLAALIRVQRGAERIVPDREHRIGPDEGIELFQAYERWRKALLEIAVEAGWDVASLEAELPPLDAEFASREPRSSYDMAAAGRKAAVRLRILVGWVEGQREALEIAAERDVKGESRRDPGDLGRFM